MPYFLAAVIGLSFLVLMLVFRSVLVPLKAALLNVLSVACGVRRGRGGLPVGLGCRA
jgi:RND superfamily putative drug exporter